jgi:hypothetical protein
MRRKLTERNIPGLKAPDAAIEIMHQMTPAAGLRITVGGAKIWFYVYRSPVLRNDHGEAKHRRAYLGYHPSGRIPTRQGGRVPSAMNVKEFEQAYDAYRALLAKGIDPQPLAVARPTAKRRKSTA